MLGKLLRVVGPVFLGIGMTLAQDPTKVEPTHYKLAFENEWVQVVNVHYGPHEKSRMHEHPGGVVVVLTDAHLKFTDPNGKTQEIYAKAGESRWFPPFKHEVENLGDSVYNAVYMGVKAKTGGAKSKTRGAYSGFDSRSQSTTLSAKQPGPPTANPFLSKRTIP
jgi:quercetin dioxygenase-like cupin family protein